MISYAKSAETLDFIGFQRFLCGAPKEIRTPGLSLRRRPKPLISLGFMGMVMPI